MKAICLRARGGPEAFAYEEAPQPRPGEGEVLVWVHLTTLSFLVTTPGVWEPSLGGFPALSAMPGQFLIKDLALLGISLWTLGEAWKASEQRG
jgi:uncharacterized membrane protein YkgB